MEVPEGEEKYIQRNNVWNQLELEGWSAEWENRWEAEKEEW